MNWFITDMDGTFLNSNREIAPNSKEVLTKLQDAGSKFIIATGRVDLAVRNYYQQMGLRDVTISCNGAFIRNQSNGEVIYQNSFSTEELEIIHRKFTEMNDGSIDFHVYTANYIYCDKISFSLARILKAEENASPEFKTPMLIDKDVIPNIKNNNDPCFKVLLTSSNHDLLLQIYKEISKEFELESVFSATDFFDLTPKGTSKGNAIKKVAQYYGLDIKDTVVFGDNYNDIDMLTVAGRAVCPSNAKDEVKEICHEIIGSHNDFSVIKYVEDYLKSLEK
ncbi:MULTISPECIES: HAD family hydrolase [unclassified Gemella]|uniref:HAD family hydrolase n=1 Tax=unclassified Gemella TaxID=2624949 RepID=UPI0015D06063|nr:MULTISPECIES: HAD family hydrolase [unclassified Gemella]MBF0709699.1 HAD family hydrolase [Gemella sp. GL1.1]NYS27043.1 HAD family hydrolase [Gemella sp. GL1]